MTCTCLGGYYDWINTFYEDESTYSIKNNKGFINKFGITRSLSIKDLVSQLGRIGKSGKSFDNNFFGSPHEGLTKIVTSQYHYSDKRNLFGFCDKNFVEIIEKIYCD